jgi:hypothetical protein
MSDQVQSNLASGILDQFHVSLGLNLQTKLQDWPGRQSLQYGSMKGLMNQDWHSLSDFKFQMNLYSSSSHTLRIAWSLIKNLVLNNAKMLASLIHLPAFGNVPLGSQVLSLVGIQNVLVAPQNILTSQASFNSTIKSVT